MYTSPTATKVIAALTRVEDADLKNCARFYDEERFHKILYSAVSRIKSHVSGIDNVIVDEIFCTFFYGV